MSAVAPINRRPTMKNFDRITVDPAQMGGVPCVRHLRIPVATVLRLLAGGLSERDILSEYPRVSALRRSIGYGAGNASRALSLRFPIDNARRPGRRGPRQSAH
jgi:uncharacterized protein (DUF433 family)